ncbi:uncharacterized protein LOC132260692 [Phlebotomus argentipes]|uniref:uncharacterized protein LOC132260692 n=1 Tax=Phlebotomus argentipes TaxID=94469 RepID=UPI002892CB31|nr:uncharacterized protein LOC132260692 [Phlebotomus argentipes]
MAALIGNIPEFYAGAQDWNVYSERLEQFFLVNNIPDDKRSALLISVIGNDTYKALRDLCHPQLPKDKPFEELCELLKKQYGPQVSVFRERKKFYTSKQMEYEGVSAWYARLKTLSVDCKFGDNLETILMDRFISGLRNPVVLDRMCEEDETLTLTKAVELAVNKESSVVDNGGRYNSYNNYNNYNQNRWQNRRGRGRGRGGGRGGCFGMAAPANDQASDAGDIAPIL